MDLESAAILLQIIEMQIITNPIRFAISNVTGLTSKVGMTLEALSAQLDSILNLHLMVLQLMFSKQLFVILYVPLQLLLVILLQQRD